MTVVYQPDLVLLSIGVAILGSLTALALTSLSQNEDLGFRSFVLANGGLIMGATIWSMHFVAMMAVEFPVVVSYNLAETMGSTGIAIVATGIGLYIASTNRFGIMSIPLGGLLMGLGIAGMHYLGMSAIRGCGLAYDTRLVAASVGIAIAASCAALWFAFYKRNLVMTLAGGVVQGLAIASMHYTAMAATYFVPLGVEIEISKPILGQNHLAYIIAGGMTLLAIGNLSLLAFVRKAPLTREQVRLVQESFKKIEASAPLVAEVLYRRLFDIAPHVRAHFPAGLGDQGARFMAMLSVAVANLDDIEDIAPAMRELGRRHADYGVNVDDYRPFGQALMWTLEQGLGEQFTPQVRAAWHAAYASLTGMMLQGAKEAKRASGFVAPPLSQRAA